MKSEQQIKEFKIELQDSLSNCNLATDGQFLQGMIRTIDWIFEEEKKNDQQQ
uniref:ORF43 n=1 Tax=Nitrosopumilaceae spindle-shaped virus TaxID=3065433 RepID=A0AAT9J9L2_9VIRU